MPIRDLDTYQKLAATTNGGEVVVSAGAGSGKTMLLVGRYLHLLKNQHVPMPSIIAITFTNKAADQMKARIAEKAHELAKDNPGDRDFWLDEVAAKVHTAPISTIHAFCNSILRSYPIEAGMDPFFTILDDTSLSELTGEAVTGFLKMRMDIEPENFDFLIRIFGMRGYKRLLRTLLGERAKIIKYLDEYDDHAPETLEREYLKHIRERLGQYLKMLHDFHAVRPGDDSLSPVLDDLVSGLANVLRMVEEDTVDSRVIRNIIGNIMPIGNRGSPKKWADRGVSPGNVRTGMKECVSFIEQVLTFYSCEKGITSHVVSSLLKEYKILEQHFLQLKKSRSYLDHDDTLIETWRLLRNNVTVRQKISRKYRHILVDEFQDTDGLQMDIIRMIAGNSPASLFTVGDPKQSIYRFRGADVVIFNDFIARPNVDFKSLKLNYRSSPAVVNFVNHVFGRIMGSDEPAYRFEASYMEMKAYRKNSDSISGIEVAVFDDGNSDACRTAEADFIARRAKELSEQQGYSYGQMALIMRKGTRSASYEKAFLAHDIPFVNLTRRNPFESPEAYDIANLLGWLCNPDDPVCFTGLLLSPFFSVSADFLYELRQRAGKSGSMPPMFLKEKGTDSFERTASRIREILNGLLSICERVTIRKIVEKAFDDTGYTLTLLADPLRGELSLTILDHILSSADTFEAQGGDIREFSRLLLNGELFSEKSASIETGHDTLTIISIHKAKGMEYKVVFLADISSRPRSDTAPFLVHKTLGPGLNIRDACGKSIKTLVKSESHEEEVKKDLAESKRLFYVGCTRAEDHLVISGSKPSKTPDDMFEKDNWMGWLHTALAISPEGDFSSETPVNLFAYNRNPAPQDLFIEPAADRWGNVLVSAESANDMNFACLDKLVAPIPDITVSGKPETISPTQAADYMECPARYLYRYIYRMSAEDSGDYCDGFGARYGTFAHKVLQGWDFSNDDRAFSRVDELAGRDIPESLQHRLRESLRRFTGTELYRQIRAADDVCHEEPFVFVHDDILVRGTIDVLFRTKDSYVIVDYKTDRLDSGDIESASENYRLQLGLYALALHRARYVIPSRLVIYFLTPGITHDIPCGEKLLDEVSNDLSKTIASLASGDFKPQQSDRCETCPYVSICGQGRETKEI